MSNLDKKYNLKLDLQFRCNNSLMKFDEFDNNTSDFFISVNNKGKKIDISNSIVTIVAIKPSQKVEAQFVEVRNGTIYADLKPSMKDEIGKYTVVASITLGNEIVNTDIFEYEVTENKFLKQLNNEVVAEERFTILTDMINRLSKIELQENSRIEAETGRVEAEKQREIVKEKLISDIEKLILDTNSKVDTSLKTNSDKITNLINDTTTKIDDYKLEKDTAIQQDLEEYKSTTTQDINTYKNDKNLEIDNYKKLKDTEINKNLSDYKTNTTADIETYKNNKNAEINQYKTEKDLEIDTYVANKNKELDRYVAAKNDDIDNYKNSKDTLINNKLEEVDTAEQSRVEAETLRQQQHTERENFLNSFESQLGQIQTDVNDLKNNGTGGNANIDDTIISKSSTWSSDKISTWSMEQDGLFWTEKEGNFVSADDTYEYKLKEIEIFGDTWQDSDSRNLFNMNNIKVGYYFGGTGEEIAETNSFYGLDYIPITVGTTYIQNTPTSSMCRLCEYDSNKTFIQRVNLSPKATYTPGEGVSYVRLAFYQAGLSHLAQLEKGTVSTTYESYHKADLSNIQHAGELYVDDEGQPILDAEGKEQYKFEIEVCNANLVKPDMEMVKGTYHEITGIFTENPSGNGRCTKNFIRVGSGGKYSYKLNSEVEPLWLRVLCFNSNYKFLGCPLGLISSNSKNGTFTMPTDTKFIKIQHLNGEKISTSNLTIIKSDTVVPYDIPHKSHKQTILLSCQLMKIGDVSDRLYWDNEKGRYVVEKNIFKPNLSNVKLGTNQAITDTHVCRYVISNALPDVKLSGYNSVNNKFNSKHTFSDISKAIASGVAFGNAVMYVCVEKSILDTPDYEGLNKWWDSNKTNINLYAQAKTPQLIEANITTPITIPTFNNKTHVYVVNSNNAKATIKAKFPLKTASVVASVKELGLKNSNSIQEQYEVNQTQDSLIDISLCATDEMYMMIELLLQSVPQTISERMVSKMVDMYVAMVIRGLKTIDEVPARYREQVKEILSKLEK